MCGGGWFWGGGGGAVPRGGAGTVHTSLKYSLPTFVIPFGADQPFNGDRVHLLGLGPAPVMVRQLTQPKMVEALRTLADDRAMRGRVEDIGRKMRAENGTARAVEIVERAIRRGGEKWLTELRMKYGPDHWMPDGETARCCRCRKRFKVNLRRHHCRACGLIFCYLCSSRRMDLQIGEHVQLVRVCFDCHQMGRLPAVAPEADVN